MDINRRFPKLEPSGFLERAFFWLDSESDLRIFYAALELRFVYEKIFLNHALASNNNSPNFDKLNWKPKRLQDELTREFSSQINLENAYQFFIKAPNSSEPVIFGYYLPFDENIYSMYGKLDQFLHAQWAIPIGYPDRRWQKEKAVELFKLARELIPYSNPKNSLNYFSIPNIKFVELDISEAKKILSEYWPE